MTLTNGLNKSIGSGSPFRFTVIGAEFQRDCHLLRSPLPPPRRLLIGLNQSSSSSNTPMIPRGLHSSKTSIASVVKSVVLICRRFGICGRKGERAGSCSFPTGDFLYSWSQRFLLPGIAQDFAHIPSAVAGTWPSFFFCCLINGLGSLSLSNLSCPDDVDDVEAWIAESTLAALPKWIASLAENGSANEVLPFPCHIFPAPIADYIREEADSLLCPPDLLGVPALTVYATAIGTSRQIEVKDGWQQQAVIFAGLVAEPGSKKSPALEKATRPLIKQQKKMKAKYLRQRREYEQNLVRFLAEEKRWDHEYKKSPVGKEQDPALSPLRPQIPKRRQIKTTDFTTEAIDVLLECNPRGIIGVFDELEDWLRPMSNRRGGGRGDRSKWQSLWNSAANNRESKRRPGTNRFVQSICQRHRLHSSRRTWGAY